MRACGLIAVFALASACAPTEEATVASVVAQDARYRALLETDLPSEAGSSGELRVRVELQGGWHIAPEAPTRLRLESPEGFELASSKVEGDAVVSSEDSLLFASAFRASRAGPTVVRGVLKFGICESYDDGCVIVRRDLELPVDVAFAD